MINTNSSTYQMQAGCSNHAYSNDPGREMPSVSLQSKAAKLHVDLATLNCRLAELRFHLFGESEGPMSKVSGADDPALAPPALQASIERAQCEAQLAMDQLTSIFSRI